MKEYQAYGRELGGGKRERKLFKLVAPNHKTALTLSRKVHLMLVVTRVKLIGTLNPKWVPEKALQCAIFGGKYKQKRLVSKIKTK